MNEIDQIVEKMTQFEVIESVVRNAQNSELDAAFFEHVGPFLKQISSPSSRKQKPLSGDCLRDVLLCTGPSLWYAI